MCKAYTPWGRELDAQKTTNHDVFTSAPPPSHAGYPTPVSKTKG